MNWKDHWEWPIREQRCPQKQPREMKRESSRGASKTVAEQYALYNQFI